MENTIVKDCPLTFDWVSETIHAWNLISIAAITIANDSHSTHFKANNSFAQTIWRNWKQKQTCPIGVTSVNPIQEQEFGIGSSHGSSLTIASMVVTQKMEKMTSTTKIDS